MHIKQIEIGGRILSLRTGSVARQANGACWIQYGDTVVLTAATMSKNPREGIDFMPLMVDYRERTFAAGKFPGGFFKREGAPQAQE
ncbi:polyribonucleotide nucleotidyltransferase, partial [bacterium]|nr:polyribonucleotide nucleotidyltransferase [bacterium]